MGAFYAGLPAETPPLVGIMTGSPLFCYPEDELESAMNVMRQSSRSIRKKADAGMQEADVNRARVIEAMTRSVVSFGENDMLSDVIEVLSAKGFGAVLITETLGRPAGVISKTDLIIAYNHGLSPATAVCSVMSVPVDSCNQEAWLVDALRQMLSRDIQPAVRS